MKKFLLSAVSILSISFLAYADLPRPQQGGEMREKIRAKVQEKIEASCGQDFATAGCSGVTGRSRIQCLQDYKSKHPDFTVSEACKSEVKEIREKGQQLRERMQSRRQNQSAGDNNK